MTNVGYVRVNETHYVHHHPDFLTVTDRCHSCSAGIVTYQRKHHVVHVRECAECLARAWDAEAQRWR